MKLKTATLIALIGVTLSYLMSLFSNLQHGLRPVGILHSSVFSLPIILFFVTLYRKQE